MKTIPQVGTKVIVKDVPVGERNGVHFVGGMRKFVGKQFTVRSVGNNPKYGDWCILDGGAHNYYWYSWMLKKVKPTKQELIDAALDDFAKFILHSDGSMTSVEWLSMYREKEKTNEKAKG